MAIIRQTDLPTGVSANYWRITHMQSDFTTGKVLVALALYLDEEKRRAKAEPVFTMRIDFNLSDLNEEINLRTAVYDKLKDLDQFVNAANA